MRMTKLLSLLCLVPGLALAQIPIDTSGKPLPVIAAAPVGAVAFTVTAPSTATTVSLIVGAPSTGNSIYVTNLSFSISVASTSTTNEQFWLRYGTDANCGTGTTAIWGSLNAANTPVAVTFSPPLKVPSDKALCWQHAVTGSKIVNMTGYTAP